MGEGRPVLGGEGGVKKPSHEDRCPRRRPRLLCRRRRPVGSRPRGAPVAPRRRGAAAGRRRRLHRAEGRAGAREVRIALATRRHRRGVAGRRTGRWSRRRRRRRPTSPARWRRTWPMARSCSCRRAPSAAIVMARIVREAGNRAEVAWAETGTLPYLARKHGEREVNVTVRAVRLPTGVYPARSASEAIAVIRAGLSQRARLRRRAVGRADERRPDHPPAADGDERRAAAALRALGHPQRRHAAGGARRHRPARPGAHRGARGAGLRRAALPAGRPLQQRPLDVRRRAQEAGQVAATGARPSTCTPTATSPRTPSSAWRSWPRWRAGRGRCADRARPVGDRGRLPRARPAARRAHARSAGPGRPRPRARCAACCTKANERMARFAAVGAGRMGRGIAIAFAYAGHRIALVDLRQRTPAGLADAVRRSREPRSAPACDVAGAARRAARRRRSTPSPRASSWSTPPAHRPRWRAAELVFEGVPETMAAKRDAFEQINRHCRDDAILTLDHQQHPGDAAGADWCARPSASSTCTGSTRPT